MTWAQTIIRLAVILTAFNVLVYLVSGPKYFAMALVYMISRFPGHAGATCVVYYLDPVGPWPGVCDRACRNPPGQLKGLDLVGACYFLSGVTRDSTD